MMKPIEAGSEELRDRVVLITGAGRGLGRSLALAFAAAGALVAANDLTPVNLDETVREIEAAGGRVRPYLFDIAKGLPARALVDQVVQQHGRLDVLINHAGVRPHQTLAAMDEWDWQRTLDVNLSGPFLLMQAALKPMAQQGGVILNIGAGEPRGALWSGQAAYFASKSGLITLSQAAAQEFSTYNIRVYTICPAETSEDPGADARTAAGLAISLCGPASLYPTGQVFWLEKKDWAQEGAGS